MSKKKAAGEPGGVSDLGIELLRKHGCGLRPKPPRIRSPRSPEPIITAPEGIHLIGGGGEPRPARSSPKPGSGQGLRCAREWGIVQCPKCDYLIIARRGTKLARCKGCGRRVRLHNRSCIYSHDSLPMVHRIISGIRGWWGAGKPFIPTHLFPLWERRAHPDLAEVTGGGRPGRRGDVRRNPRGEKAGQRGVDRSGVV